MTKAKKITLILLTPVVLFVAAVAIAAVTIKPDKYRAQIADTLSKQIGRSVGLNGPMNLNITMSGIGLGIQNVSIGNPVWASRPEMAKIGKLELGIALMPLLQHQLVVTKLNVGSADILLETNAANQNNWDMKPAASTEAAPPAPAVGKKVAATSSSPVGIRINELSVTDSKLGIRGKDGKTNTLDLKKLALSPAASGTTISFDGDYDGKPVEINLTADTTDIIDATKWPFKANVSYDKYRFEAEGKADRDRKSYEITTYTLSADGSSVKGSMVADLSGAVPSIRGSISANSLNVSDFMPPASPEQEKAAKAPATGEQRLFSTAPLDLSGLKAADASIDLMLGDVKFNKTTLDHLAAKIQLANGKLILSPLKATLGSSDIEGKVEVDGTGSIAQYNLSIKAPTIELGDLQKAAGISPVVTGKGDADIELSGSGDSLHELAASTNGQISVIAANGTISTASAGAVAGGLMQILSPGGNSSPTLDCMAVRYVVAKGIAKDNGILMDSSASTVAGKGGFDLGAETVDMTLNAKPKLVNTQGFMPPLVISGPLTSPHYNIDTAGAIKTVATNLLAKNNLGGLLGGKNSGSGSTTSSSAVPTLMTAPAGENACVYTLDHKPAATPASSSGVSAGSSTANPLKSLGGKLKGLFGQ